MRKISNSTAKPLAPFSLIVARECKNIGADQPLPTITLSNKELQLLNSKTDIRGRYQFCLARKLIKQAVSEHSSIAIEAIETLADNNGKPYISINNNANGYSDAINVSISHSKNWLLLSIATNHANQAVDIEYINKQRKIYKFSEKYYTIAEKKCINNSDNPYLAFYRLWSIKECLYKIDNDTLPHRISFEFNQDEMVNPGCNHSVISYRQKDYQVSFINTHVDFVSCITSESKIPLSRQGMETYTDIGFI